VASAAQGGLRRLYGKARAQVEMIGVGGVNGLLADFEIPVGDDFQKLRRVGFLGGGGPGLGQVVKTRRAHTPGLIQFADIVSVSPTQELGCL